MMERFVIAIVKDGQRWVFIYDTSSVSRLLQVLGQYASDPDLDFSWYDAAVVSQKVKRMSNDDMSDAA